ncbi:MAG: DNA polymerase III subunit gamma/tau [Candidatus Magasanikbacteria bacterium]
MALYHIYRPQVFSEIVEQRHIIQTLTNQIKYNKVSHAYLFTGPRGVGKTTTARILAKSLNCDDRKEGTFEPCNKCSSCLEISNSSSIDVIEIDAASHTGVDNVRQNIIENSQFKPTRSKYKIFIIDEVHMLSTAAFNALLKTLEEPPSYVTFILATTDTQKIPATIISRCQRYTFTKVPNTEMQNTLEAIAKKEGIKIDKDVLFRIAKKSEGCLRDGISLLEQLLATGEKKITEKTASLILPTANIEQQIEFVEYLANKNDKEAIKFIGKLNLEGTNISYFSKEFIEFLRIMMISSVDKKLAEQEMDLNNEQKKQIEDVLNIISAPEIIKLLDLAIKRDSEIKNSVLPQLPLEMLVIEWCNLGQSIITTENKTTTPLPTPKSLPEKKSETIPQNISNIEKIESKKEENFEKQTSEKSEEIVVEKTSSPEIIKDISISQVESVWNEFIKKVEKEAPSMTFILKMAKINGVEKNVIKIAVEYSFHKEKLLETSNKTKFENFFSELLGSSIKLEILEIANSDKQNDNSYSQIGDLAAALGGEIIV